MTNEQRFTEVMALMMGIQAIYLEPCPCSKCGTDLASWSPITPEGELTPEVRKFCEKELAEWWNQYLYETHGNTWLSTKGWKRFDIILKAQLDWRNLWGWMKKNREWNEKECPECGGQGGWHRPDDYGDMCFNCNGTGKVPRWDVAMEGEG